MRRWLSLVMASLLGLLFTLPAAAIELPVLQPITTPILINPGILFPEPIPVSFSAVPNRYSGLDPSTSFDMSGDLVPDLKVGATEVTALNGAKVQLLNPQVLNLDQVHMMPGFGYGNSAKLELSRAYAMTLTNGAHVKFMVMQAAPKVTIWFMYGRPTESVLKIDGTNSRAVLTWDPLSDAALGYYIYRYEVTDTSYTVTPLTDFTVRETTYTDNTAANRYYIYMVQAIKAGGTPGSLTTSTPVFIQSRARKIALAPNSTAAKLDGTNISLTAQPVIKNGRLMVPASLLTHAGAQVNYDSAAKKLTITRRRGDLTYTVVMTIDAPDYTWNGTTQKIDVPAYLVGSNQVMVPLSLMGVLLGLGVTYNSTDRTAEIGWNE